MATSKASTEPLFSADLISPEVQSQLPTHYKMRPLQSSDYALGFLDVLRVLTTVGEISEQAWVEQVEYMRRQAGTYYILVIVATEVEGKERVVGCGSLIAERKL
jgi:glucosamine-phosphate N-acetyltransferase